MMKHGFAQITGKHRQAFKTQAPVNKHFQQGSSMFADIT